jgi:prepilin-type N-terminal cleavage/methylation domain-containing protein
VAEKPRFRHLSKFKSTTVISRSVSLKNNLRHVSPPTPNGLCSGFTLIELIVVISLIGLMLFFSLPRLQNNPFLDDSKKSSRWLIGKVRTLKENAIRDQKRYTLHFDLDGGRMWETNESMSQEELELAVLNSFELPEDVRIMDVEYPSKGKISSGQVEIAFYKAGYTDKALVHIQEGERYLSFLIEPFLPKVQFFETYASFDD